MAHRSRHHRGVVLLLSMLLVAAITASTIAVATIITNTDRQSSNLNNFILASLAADSGIERGLAIVKVGRVSQKLLDTAGAASAPISFGVGEPSAAPTASQSSGPFSLPRLVANHDVSFDMLSNPFYHPANGGAHPLLATCNDGSGSDDGTMPDCDPNPPVRIHLTANTTGNGTLRISYTVIDSSGNDACVGELFKTASEMFPTHSIDLLTEASSTKSNVRGSCPTSVTNPLGFRFRVRALNQDVTNLVIQPVDTNQYHEIPPDDRPYNLLDRVVISSVGMFGNSQSAKTVSIPWQLPSTPLFNFVLYSEKDVNPQ